MKALVLSEKGVWPEMAEVMDENSNELVYPTVINSALNHRDVWIVKGLYPGIKYPAILGSDGVGMLDSRRVLINPSIGWGDDQSFQSPAYKILGLPDSGTFAERVGVPPGNIYAAPSHLSNEEAAALPLAGLTAYRALFVQAQPKTGEKVLITGIGGGVALFAMQFALAFGLKVYVNSGSDEKIRRACEMGASAGVNYRNAGWVKSLAELEPEGIDIVIDSAAGESISELMKVCNPGARIVIYGGTAGKIPSINPQMLFWKQIRIIGSTMGSDQDFQQMLEFVAQNKIHPVVDSVFEFRDANAAFQRMESSGQFGKIVFSNQ